jgi:polysaccharide export outer membrane protein
MTRSRSKPAGPGVWGSRPLKQLVTLALALAALVAAGCGPNLYETYEYGKEWDPRKHEYIIGVSDVVRVNVYHNTELSGEGTVRPDGVITMPLIGDLPVAGKTPTQVREEMKKQLAAYVKADTVITVTVNGFNSYRFIVSGNVNHPGALAQKWYVTVSEALAMAGGPSKFAGDEIMVIRLDPNGHSRRIPLSYRSLLSGKHPEQDICVVAGDTIVMD